MNLPMSLGYAPQVAPSPDPLTLLRQATQVAHDAVEALPAMRRLFGRFGSPRGWLRIWLRA